MIRERIRKTVSGWVMLPVVLAVDAVVVWLLVQQDGRAAPAVIAGILIPVLLLSAILLFGLFVVNPNEAKVMTLFGRYSGTVKQDGFHWANPLLSKRRI